MPPRAGAAGIAPHLLLLVMIAFWGGSYASVKVALETLPPFAVVGARFWLASLCLLPIVLRGEPGTMARTCRNGCITGTVLLLGYALQTLGMTETTASMGGFLSGLIVLLVAIGGVVFLGASMRTSTVVGLLLGLLGLVPLCISGADPDVQGNTLRGVLLQVASSTSYAGHILLISRLSPRGGEVQFCLWQLLTVALGASLLQFAVDGVPAAAPWSEPRLLWNIAYLGILATGLSIAVQSRVQPLIPPTHVAVLFAMQPVFGALAGGIFLGDQFGWRQLLGGGLIVLGVLVVALRR